MVLYLINFLVALQKRYGFKLQPFYLILVFSFFVFVGERKELSLHSVQCVISCIEEIGLGSLVQTR